MFEFLLKLLYFFLQFFALLLQFGYNLGGLLEFWLQGLGLLLLFEVGGFVVLELGFELGLDQGELAVGLKR